jgi:hypothetical protein
MKKLALFVAYAACISATLYADPIAVRLGPLTEDRNYTIISAVVSLWAESLIIVFLARRRNWMQDASIWFLVTTATYLLFIILPVRLGVEIKTFRDVYGFVFLTLEAFVVIGEAIILWLIWLRPKGFLTALAFSLVGNLASYGISLLFLHHAFEVHYNVLR